MHELSIVQALSQQVEGIAKELAADKVLRIVVEVGELSHITPEHLQEAFVIFREGESLLESAQLEIRMFEGEGMLLRDLELEIFEEAHNGRNPPDPGVGKHSEGR